MNPISDVSRRSLEHADKPFSIIVTCYNQWAFIQQAVESALLQRHAGEIIVVDDGSVDGSAEVLEQYADRVQLVKFAVNGGAIAARNYGAARARGRFLVFLDGDDALMPWSLDVYAQVIQTRNPKLILGMTRWVHHSVPSVGSAPDRIEFVEYDELFSKDRPAGLCASAYVVERQAFVSAGGWSPEIFQLDLQDLSAKLGCAGKVILICSPTTAFYRIHSSNTILDVQPFLRNIRKLMAKEKDGEYPGGSARRLRRLAWLGGLVIFWVKRALKAGFHADAIRLAASGWIMILAAVLLRARTVVLGKRPVETIRLGT